MKAAIIVFPGSNCDRDVQVALQASLGVPVPMIWHRETALPALDLIVVPGGFSYGDYLRGGAMAAHSPVMREVTRRARSGVRVLGICNGFQILTECGLLPGVLMRNAGLKFVCRPVALTVGTTASPYTAGYRKGQTLRMPVAHNEGNYFADPATLDRLEAEDRIAFRYAAGDNPNGSQRDIAGILNEDRTVLGMMPHPERASDAALGGTDGKPLFEALATALAA